jgi:hypothetical protein
MQWTLFSFSLLFKSKDSKQKSKSIDNNQINIGPQIIIIIIIITDNYDNNNYYNNYIIIIVSCYSPFLPGTSLEPAVNPTAQASSFTLLHTAVLSVLCVMFQV